MFLGETSVVLGTWYRVLVLLIYLVCVYTRYQVCTINPFRTAVPFWGQFTQISSSLSPKRDWGSKGVNATDSNARNNGIGYVIPTAIPVYTWYSFRVIPIGEFFFQFFDIFFAQFFNLPYVLSWFFFPNVWILTNLFFCFWRISRIVSERLRILIHISIYVQILEIMKKTLSDTNEPFSSRYAMQINIVHNGHVLLYEQRWISGTFLQDCSRIMNRPAVRVRRSSQIHGSGLVGSG